MSRASRILLLLELLAPVSALPLLSEGIASPKMGTVVSSKEPTPPESAGGILPGIGGILPGIGGLLVGVAAILAAIYNKKQLDDFKREFVSQMVAPDNIAIMTNQGGFLSEHDLPRLGRILQVLLMEEVNLNVLRRHGNFVDRANTDQLTAKISEHTIQLRDAVNNLLNLQGTVNQLRTTIDEQEMRKKLVAELKQRYPGLSPVNETQE